VPFREAFALIHGFSSAPRPEAGAAHPAPGCGQARHELSGAQARDARQQWILADGIKTIKTPGGHHRIPVAALGKFLPAAQALARPLRISGRNQLVGTVTQVKIQVLLAKVVLAIDEQQVSAIITADADRELALRKSDTAAALIRSSDVMIIPPLNLPGVSESAQRVSTAQLRRRRNYLNLIPIHFSLISDPCRLQPDPCSLFPRFNASRRTHPSKLSMNRCYLFRSRCASPQIHPRPLYLL
jgi:molybdopterin-binding protein